MYYGDPEEQEDWQVWDDLADEDLVGDDWPDED